ncbi:Glutamate-aspartate carrier protein [Legionella massiliensis]|uniref:Glutamate-aspartate carrier protein n=1 Tax=Legionella massiliensis TaxID=1034943 RepID=A0A078L0K7_9GAMM|nr:dicarboxylate/amino acid:cation symporter [Legionella massiliensis]CDZ77584.1 Glutamate-aspartate carrier protein [Legionella massiliensis]CEE13322.1 Proton/sodium-glutamate symport protein [Legionella massiliensis]
MITQNKTLSSYFFSLSLIASIILGGLAGYFLGPATQVLKPFGDIFLNLIFTAIVPLIFFSVSSAIAKTGSMGKLGKIIFTMIIVFLFTSLIAASYSLVIVKLFPPAAGVSLVLPEVSKAETLSLSKQIAGIFTVSDFASLLSHNNMLALIIFSILVGIAVTKSSEKGKIFKDFLQAGEEVFMRVFSLIMYYAPIGFFAYFAVLVAGLGPKIMENYLRIALIYYVSSIIYFLFASTLYAYLAGKLTGIKLFWKNIFLPLTTSLATCSSAASIPANLLATKSMRVPPEISETVVPLGAIIHKDGSVIGGMFKIAFLFGIFHMDFTGTSVLLTAVGVSVLVGTVMGAIPSGGMLGELLILAIYGFQPSVLIAIAAISIIIDPLATMLSVTGNCVSTMMIARWVEPRKNS